ncbi:MAG TPA: FHA domain-containing serine/threonine-protein kinase [Ktedonobacteraceae bacterium]|nr:FHA domain-containing serine/threonine-protein kinase [Ktedonobacteraceae bacterium]
MGEERRKSPRLIGGIYQLGQVITSGGMLTTFTAYNRNTSDVVGLLVIEFSPAMDVQAVQQLLHPFEKRRFLHSPNVIGVHDWAIDGTRLYIATDPPRGITLRHVLDNENIDLPRALDLARQMAQGLKVLHQHGIAGVDLRPQLITVDTVTETDRVQLDDIGLRSLLNALGYVSGQRFEDIGFLDPRYSPPEYIGGGGAIGPWSDVYQLGLLLFEMVTGRLPFVGKNPAETSNLQITAAIPRLAQYKLGMPSSLQSLVDCALAKNPAARFADAAVLLSALESIHLPPRNVIKEGAARHVAGITGEMRFSEHDIALSATLIEGSEATSPVIDDPATLPETADTYAYLCYEKDGVELQRFAIAKNNVIVGRMDPKRGLSPDVDLTVIDQKMTVSRQHARIRYEETFFYIEDLKSRNKTRLGDVTLVPLKPELLRHGDIVQCGSVCLIFKMQGKE